MHSQKNRFAEMDRMPNLLEDLRDVIEYMAKDIVTISFHPLHKCNGNIWTIRGPKENLVLMLHYQDEYELTAEEHGIGNTSFIKQEAHENSMVKSHTMGIDDQLCDVSSVSTNPPSEIEAALPHNADLTFQVADTNHLTTFKHQIKSAVLDTYASSIEDHLQNLISLNNERKAKNSEAHVDLSCLMPTDKNGMDYETSQCYESSSDNENIVPALESSFADGLRCDANNRLTAAKEHQLITVNGESIFIKQEVNENDIDSQTLVTNSNLLDTSSNSSITPDGQFDQIFTLQSVKTEQSPCDETCAGFSEAAICHDLKYTSTNLNDLIHDNDVAQSTIQKEHYVIEMLASLESCEARANRSCDILSDKNDLMSKAWHQHVDGQEADFINEEVKEGNGVSVSKKINCAIVNNCKMPVIATPTGENQLDSRYAIKITNVNEDLILQSNQDKQLSCDKDTLQCRETKPETDNILSMTELSASDALTVDANETHDNRLSQNLVQYVNQNLRILILENSKPCDSLESEITNDEIFNDAAEGTELQHDYSDVAVSINQENKVTNKETNSDFNAGEKHLCCVSGSSCQSALAPILKSCQQSVCNVMDDQLDTYGPCSTGQNTRDKFSYLYKSVSNTEHSMSSNIENSCTPYLTSDTETMADNVSAYIEETGDPGQVSRIKSTKKLYVIDTFNPTTGLENTPYNRSSWCKDTVPNNEEISHSAAENIYYVSTCDINDKLASDKQGLIDDAATLLLNLAFEKSKCCETVTVNEGSVKTTELLLLGKNNMHGKHVASDTCYDQAKNILESEEQILFNMFKLKDCSVVLEPLQMFSMKNNKVNTIQEPTKIHIGKHLESNNDCNILCSHCEKHFKMTHNLKSLKRFETSKLVSYWCSHCNKLVCYTYGFNCDEQVQSEDSFFQCTICGSTFQELDSFNLHVSEKHPPQYKKKVKQHKQDIKNDKVYKCSLCDRKFNLKYQLEQHQVIHSGERPYECLECHKTFSHKTTLLQHQVIHSGEKPFKCLECGKTFSHRSTLHQHRVIHSGEKPHECLQCGKRFFKNSSLIQHMLVHSGEKPHECSLCGRKFADYGTARNHEKLHTAEKIHKCSQCEKKFKCKLGLRKHERTHSGEKPYECSECGMKITTKFGLQRHMRVHTGERPYECLECGKKFSQTSALNEHKLIHGGKNPYECEQCGIKFRFKKTLFKHESDVHNKQISNSDSD